MIKDIQFDQLIKQQFGNSEKFQKLENQIKNVRQTMSKYDEFKKLKVKTQFEFCVTIAIIATQTASQSLQGVKLLGNVNSETLEYSIDR